MAAVVAADGPSAPGSRGTQAGGSASSSRDLRSLLSGARSKFKAAAHAVNLASTVQTRAAAAKEAVENFLSTEFGLQRYDSDSAVLEVLAEATASDTLTREGVPRQPARSTATPQESMRLQSALNKPVEERTKEDLHLIFDSVNRILPGGWLSSLPASHRESLARGMSYRQMEEGGLAFMQGNPGRFFYIVLSGECALWEDRPGANPNVLSNLKEHHYAEICEMTRSAGQRLRRLQEELDVASHEAVGGHMPPDEERVYVAARQWLSAATGLHVKLEQLTKHVSATLEKKTYATMSTDIQERCATLASRARGVAMSTKLVVRAKEAAGEKHLTSRRVYVTMAQLFTLLAAALDGFAARDFHQDMGWRVADLHTGDCADELAFLSSDRRHQFTLEVTSPIASFVRVNRLAYAEYMLNAMSRALLERARALSKFSFFSGLDGANIVRLAWVSKEISFPFGSYLTKYNKKNEWVYFIEEGTVTLSVPPPEELVLPVAGDAEAQQKAEARRSARAASEDAEAPVAAGDAPHPVPSRPAASGRPNPSPRQTNTRVAARRGSVLSQLDEAAGVAPPGASGVEAATSGLAAFIRPSTVAHDSQSRMYGREVDVATLGPGSAIGLGDAIDLAPQCSAWTRATTAVVALRISRHDLMDRLRLLPEALKAAQHAANQTRRLHEQVSERAYLAVGKARSDMTKKTKVALEQEAKKYLGGVSDALEAEDERVREQVEKRAKRTSGADAQTVTYANIDEIVRQLDEADGVEPRRWFGQTASPRLLASKPDETFKRIAKVRGIKGSDTSPRLKQIGGNVGLTRERAASGANDASSGQAGGAGVSAGAVAAGLGPGANPSRMPLHSRVGRSAPASRPGPQGIAGRRTRFGGRNERFTKKDVDEHFLSHLASENDALLQQYCRDAVSGDRRGGRLYCRSTQWLGQLALGARKVGGEQHVVKLRSSPRAKSAAGKTGKDGGRRGLPAPRTMLVPRSKSSRRRVISSAERDRRGWVGKLEAAAARMPFFSEEEADALWEAAHNPQPAQEPAIDVAAGDAAAAAKPGHKKGELSLETALMTPTGADQSPIPSLKAGDGRTEGEPSRTDATGRAETPAEAAAQATQPHSVLSAAGAEAVGAGKQAETRGARRLVA